MYSFGMGLVRPGCQAIRLQDSLIKRAFLINRLIIFIIFADRETFEKGRNKEPFFEWHGQGWFLANEIAGSFDQQYLLN